MLNVTSQKKSTDFNETLERKIKKVLKKYIGKNKNSIKKPKSGKGL